MYSPLMMDGADRLTLSKPALSGAVHTHKRDLPCYTVIPQTTCLTYSNHANFQVLFLLYYHQQTCTDTVSYTHLSASYT